MAWTGSVTDTETARRASMCVQLAENMGLIVDGDLTSLAAAQAAVIAAEAELPVSQQIYSVDVNRALEVAADFGASVTGSSLATFYGALPDNNGMTARMLG